jgi:XTP/dITP diphosphohydrolase
MIKLLLATTNKGKISEYRYMFQGLAIDLVSPAEEGINLEVDEKHATLAENAIEKAKSFHEISGLITLADDSGLEVDALNGEPGVRSARYAGENASDTERVRYLLARLTGITSAKRTARFRCAIALVGQGKPVQVFEGVCEGVIVNEPRGDNGFGYDPVFLFPHLNKTMAELTSEIKNQISHRALAARKARPVLQEIMEKGSK